MNKRTEKRRDQPRLDADIPADIIIPGKVAVAPCQVVEVSPAGARLQLSTSWVIPRSFSFRLAGAARIFHSTVIWRQGDLLGVEFRPDQRRDWWTTVTEWRGFGKTVMNRFTEIAPFGAGRSDAGGHGRMLKLL
jgi:hypothetical protein